MAAQLRKSLRRLDQDGFAVELATLREDREAEVREAARQAERVREVERVRELEKVRDRVAKRSWWMSWDR